MLKHWISGRMVMIEYLQCSMNCSTAVNISDVTCDELFATNVSDRPCCLDNRLRTAIIEQASAFCIGKISGHLEWSSTTTKKIQPLIGREKSTMSRTMATLIA